MRHIHLHGGGCHDACCLKIENLSVRFGSDPVLEDVNLHIRPGEMLALHPCRWSRSTAADRLCPPESRL